jgi:hypothetical protein
MAKRSFARRVLRIAGILLVVLAIGVGVLYVRAMRVETQQLDGNLWVLLGGGGT